MQPSSSLDDVLYPRDYYTPTGKGASGCVIRALMEEVAAVEVAVKETELKSPKKKTKGYGVGRRIPTAALYVDARSLNPNVLMTHESLAPSFGQ